MNFILAAQARSTQYLLLTLMILITIFMVLAILLHIQYSSRSSYIFFSKLLIFSKLVEAAVTCLCVAIFKALGRLPKLLGPRRLLWLYHEMAILALYRFNSCPIFCYKGQDDGAIVT